MPISAERKDHINADQQAIAQAGARQAKKMSLPAADRRHR